MMNNLKNIKENPDRIATTLYFHPDIDVYLVLQSSVLYSIQHVVQSLESQCKVVMHLLFVHYMV
jgi:hypothetical protein